jgi:hypothetical protein
LIACILTELGHAQAAIKRIRGPTISHGLRYLFASNTIEQHFWRFVPIKTVSPYVRVTTIEHGVNDLVNIHGVVLTAPIFHPMMIKNEALDGLRNSAKINTMADHNAN